MKKIFVLGVFSLFVFVQATAQNTTHQVTGRLVEAKSNNPLELVEILVANMDDKIQSSFLSNKDGLFQMDLESGTYQLTFRQLGEILSKDTITVSKSLDLHDIILNYNGISLDEVTVVSAKRMYENSSDRIAFNVQNSPFAKGFNAKDVLNFLPRIDPTSYDEVRIIGKTDVLVFINGREKHMSGRELASYLRSIPSDRINKVELITNPSSEYDSNGNTAVLNILLKDRNIGFEGRANLAYHQYSRASFNEMLNLNYSNQLLNINYTIDNWDDRRGQKLNNEFDSASYVRKSKDIQRNKYRILDQNLNLNLFLSPKMNLGFESSVSLSKNKGNRTTDINISRTSEAAENIYESVETSRPYRTYTVSPYWDWTFDDLGKKLTLNYTHRTTISSLDQNFTSSEPLDFTHSSNGNNYHVNIYKADLNLPFSWLKMQLGGKFSHFRTLNSTEFITTDKFLYKESISAAYIDLDKGINRLTLKMGLRYEHTKSEGTPQEKDKAFTKKYGDWFPYANASYKVGANSSFTLGYSRRIMRPSLNSLNPTPKYHDSYNYTIGNPEISPEIINNIDAKYLYKNLYFDMYYSHDSRSTTTICTVVDNKTVEQSIVNGYNSNTFGVDASYYWSKKWIDVSLSASAMYISSTPIISQIIDKTQGWGANFSPSITFTLSKNASIYTSYFYSFPTEMYLIHTRSTSSFSVGCNLRLLKDKLSVNIQAQDLFNGLRNRNTTYYRDYTYRKNIDNENRCLRITLSYKFGNHKVKKSNVRTESGGQGRLFGIKE